MLTGADISTWQDSPDIPGEVDFVKMKNAGADFVIFKVSQSTFKDQVFMDSWPDAKGVLPRGGYHWLSWNKPGLEQAKYFCDALSKDMPEILHPVIDFEDRIGVPQNANGHLWNALDYIEDQLHLISMIYTSPYYWMEFGSKDKAWAKYPLWIANYYVTKPMIPAPWTNWTMWQYTPKGDGKKYGVESLQIDMDYFNGDMAQFTKWCGDPIAQPKTLEQRVATLESLAIARGWVVG